MFWDHESVAKEHITLNKNALVSYLGEILKMTH